LIATSRSRLFFGCIANAALELAGAGPAASGSVAFPPRARKLEADLDRQAPGKM
jgi:hypothetical protein